MTQCLFSSFNLFLIVKLVCLQFHLFHYSHDFLTRLLLIFFFEAFIFSLAISFIAMLFIIALFAFSTLFSIDSPNLFYAYHIHFLVILLLLDNKHNVFFRVHLNQIIFSKTAEYYIYINIDKTKVSILITNNPILDKFK